jgi:hypothetical protein
MPGRHIQVLDIHQHEYVEPQLARPLGVSITNNVGGHAPITQLEAGQQSGCPLDTGPVATTWNCHYSLYYFTCARHAGIKLASFRQAKDKVNTYHVEQGVRSNN